VCVVAPGGRTLLATGSDDRTVRLWDLRTGNCIVVVPVHHPVLGVAAADGLPAIGLDVGVLVIKLGTVPWSDLAL
jgi:WD40 repeat protein